MAEPFNLQDRTGYAQQCAEFLFRLRGASVVTNLHDWSLVASDADELTAKLDASGRLVPLAKRSAAPPNLIAVALGEFLRQRLDRLGGVEGHPGTWLGKASLSE